MVKTQTFDIDYSTPEKFDELVSNLEALVEQDRYACAEFVWQLLVTIDGDSIPAFGSWARDLCVLLAKSLGKEDMERRLISQWEHLPIGAKLNFCHGVDDPDAFATDLCLSLFRSQFSSVDVRHVILASLAATADLRGIGAEIPKLASIVGAYSDAYSQKLLERFLADLQASFPSPP